MKKTNNHLISFDDLPYQQYSRREAPAREKFEQELEAFRVGILIRELRKEKGMTQQQLAEKCGTTKNYISRIENDTSDIRLSTLMPIIREGLGGRVRLTVEPA